MVITVVGGSGFLGGRAVALLRGQPGVEVRVASRRGPVHVDLAQPATFAALEGSDVVVNVSNSSTAPPDALAQHCLQRGLVMLEASSDRPTVERLLALTTPGPGLVVLGAGIFTGLSNLMGQAVAQKAAPARSVFLAVASSPYSGSGQGTVDLMVDALSVPAVRFEAGQRLEAPMGAGPAVEFGPRRRWTISLSMPEPVMLHRSTGVARVQMLFAPKPGVVALAFGLMPGWLVRARWFAAVTRVTFALLRRLVLRAVPTAVELLATAEGAQSAALLLRTADGMRAGGAALAAIGLALARQRPARGGVCCVDEVLTLEPVVEAANVLAGLALIELG